MLDILIIAVVLLNWLVLPPLIADLKGYSWKIWLAAGIFLPIASLIAIILLPHRKSGMQGTKFETAHSDPANQKEETFRVNKSNGTRKSYDDEFKKRVAVEAMKTGANISEVARKYGVNPTLVRNWREKFGSDADPANKADKNSTGAHEGVSDGNANEPNLIWHIDRAKFHFEDEEEYNQWKEDPKVFFEFSPDQSDDGGEMVFVDASDIGEEFEVTEDRGLIKISLEEDGPVISAWVGVFADLADDVDEDVIIEWSSDYGGWASSTIHLGNFDATIVEDDGGEWRRAQDEED